MASKAYQVIEDSSSNGVSDQCHGLVPLCVCVHVCVYGGGGGGGEAGVCLSVCTLVLCSCSLLFF